MFSRRSSSYTTQYRHPTLEEIARREYINDRITLEEFEQRIESYLRAGRMDYVVPGHPYRFR